jgi:hypothetical protein
VPASVVATIIKAHFSFGFAMALRRRKLGASPSGPRDGPPSPSIRRSSSRKALISFSESRAITSMAKFDPIGE